MALKDQDQLALLHPKKRNKYNAQRVFLDGYTFSSKAEAARYVQLLKDDKVSFLIVHPYFEFKNGKKYIADFQYHKQELIVIEDVKSKPTRTALYRFKKAQIKSEFGIEIQEIEMDPKTADILIKGFTK